MLLETSRQWHDNWKKKNQSKNLRSTAPISCWSQENFWRTISNANARISNDSPAIKIIVACEREASTLAMKSRYRPALSLTVKPKTRTLESFQRLQVSKVHKYFGFISLSDRVYSNYEWRSLLYKPQTLVNYNKWKKKGHLLMSNKRLASPMGVFVLFVRIISPRLTVRCFLDSYTLIHVINKYPHTPEHEKICLRILSCSGKSGTSQHSWIPCPSLRRIFWKLWATLYNCNNNSK